MLIFISGGVRSGKSSFAEKCAMEAAYGGRSLHYIATAATAAVTDAEMAERIKHHQEIRRQSGTDWQTWEQPAQLAKISDRFNKTDVVLLDCLTILLSNELFDTENGSTDWKQVSYQKDVFRSIIDAVMRIENNSAVVIVVSNELLSEPFSTDQVTAVYLRLIAQLHKMFVSVCNKAYLVEHGVPIKMKG
jgi:adenosylcobinamide kinase/adenosylcobinamide-phosphate guanylyltransferase